MSRPTKSTSPPTTTHPTAVVSPTASLTGIYPITVGANTIIHLRAKLSSSHGPITIGEGCIIGERANLGLQDKEPDDGGKGVVVGSGVVIESGARVLGSIGDGSVVEVGAEVKMGSVVGKVGRKISCAIISTPAAS